MDAYGQHRAESYIRVGIGKSCTGSRGLTAWEVRLVRNDGVLLIRLPSREKHDARLLAAQLRSQLREETLDGFLGKWEMVEVFDQPNDLW